MMSQRESDTASARQRHGQRGITRRADAAVMLALFAVAGILVSCSPASVGSTASGDTTVTVIATAAPSPSTTPLALEPRFAPRKPGYRLAFHDEFIGPKLDTKRWTTSLPWGNTNHDEQQYYTPSALSQRQGVLTITARRQATHGKAYTSGAISSFRHFNFTYGYAEIRAQVPAGTGLWPAFWLPATVRGSNDELDVLELIGSDPSQGYAVVHYGTTQNRQDSVGTYRNPDFSVGFHTFAIDWEPGSIVWYVDGVERRRVSQNIPSHRMTLIANLTVGGPTSWPGAPDRYTVFPAQFKIDYIRVYQRR